jgi:hypothetical protein
MQHANMDTSLPTKQTTGNELGKISGARPWSREAAVPNKTVLLHLPVLFLTSACLFGFRLKLAAPGPPAATLSAPGVLEVLVPCMGGALLIARLFFCYKILKSEQNSLDAPRKTRDKNVLAVKLPGAAGRKRAAAVDVEWTDSVCTCIFVCRFPPIVQDQLFV